MRFLSPAWLLLLFGVAALVGAYVWFQLRKPRHAVRFTNLDLLDSVAPERPGKRRHVVAGLFGISLVLLVVALAQPVRAVEVPNEMATVVLTIDTSLSMEATDVEPSRIEAATVAAIEFLGTVPEELQVGLVSFNGATSVDVAPTTDHEAVVAAIEGLALGEGTAIGDAIATSVDVVQDAVADQDADADQTTTEDGAPEQPPGAVILLSDGENQVGQATEDGIEQAQEAGVPISTIAYGTDDASIEIDGIETPVGVDAQALADVAEQTGGAAFDADSAEELDAVYADIGSTIGYEEEDRDVSRWFLGAGLITLLVCAGLSLAWSSRIL
jgi:Ca-activated chloride channel family protein